MTKAQERKPLDLPAYLRVRAARAEDEHDWLSVHVYRRAARELEQLAADLGEARRERDAQAERVKALEKACRPFDVLYASCGVRQNDKLAFFTDKDGHCRWFTVGELKRLHEALDRKGG